MPPVTTPVPPAVVHREITASASATPVRLGGLSLLFGGVLFAFFGIVFFRYTHGPTGTDQEGTLFGLGGTAYGRMEVLWPALLLAGLSVTHRVLADRLSPWGRRGLHVALLSQAMMIAAVVMQWWLKDGHNAEDFESVTLTLGFYLGALSCLLLSAGMCVFGLSCGRLGTPQGAGTPAVLVGLLALPTAVVELMGMSVAGIGDELVMSAVRLPLSVCWILLGWSLYSRAEEHAAAAAPGRGAGVALDRRVRVLGAMLRRATGPVATMPEGKRQALREQKAPRAVTDYLNGRRARGVMVTDSSVPSDDGPLGVRVYRPTDHGGCDLPVIVAFHGGGWMFGNLDTAQWLWSEVAARVPAVVVAGTYRLAPENPAPAALDDAFAITAWAAEHASELGGSREPVVVMGESSGGTLAAAVALRARDTAAFPLSFQALIYPITDLTLSSPSIDLLSDQPILTAHDLRAYVTAYLGSGGSPADPYVSPLLAPDHHGLPPALILGADHDPLRDDARRYAERLRGCDVLVEHVELADSPHGVFSFPNLCRASGPGLDILVSSLRKASRSQRR